MKVQQAGALLNGIVQQATGATPIAVTNASDFISVATTALKTGYDPIINALSQMWGRTIFSVRPYSRKFRGMEMSAERWGNATRKLSIVDDGVLDDERFVYPVGHDTTQNPANGDGNAVDMYKLNKPNVLQTNFYGQSVYENYYTIFRDNLDVAFSGPDEFMRFNAMVAQNRTDKLEQYRENIARALLGNYIGALITEADNSRVVHLLTEYNTATGLNLTETSIYQPANFAPFMRWVYARVSALVQLMSERSQLFQTNITGKPIMRHTPAGRVKCYMYTPAWEQINAMVLSTTYNGDLLKLVDFEGVNYWQSISTPDAINVTPVYTDNSGDVVTASQSVQQNNIFGVLFDEDALGYSQTNAWSALTPFNVAGGYWNDYDHVNFRTMQDMTEKGIVLLLD